MFSGSDMHGTTYASAAALNAHEIHQTQWFLGQAHCLLAQPLVSGQHLCKTNDNINYARAELGLLAYSNV